MNGGARRWRLSVAYLERVAMRNAFGLMLASIVTAVAIAGVWYWTSPRADAAPPQTIAAKPAAPSPAAQKLAVREDVETTASLSSRLAAMPAPPVATSAKPSCANPDALGVARVVEV